jgi:hypothetical protein
MQLFYAIYDPAISVEGNYWTWFADEINKADRECFYGTFAVNNLPSNPNDLQTSDLWGGIVRLPNSDWTVVYRFFNGGYDKLDRPGRYVIMTAWVKTIDTIGKDLSPIFNSLVFNNISEHSKEIPVPEPNFLTEDFIGQPIKCPQEGINHLLQTKEHVFFSGDVISQAVALFVNIPLKNKLDSSIQHESIENAEVHIEKTTKQSKAIVRVKFQPKPEPPKSEYIEKTEIVKNYSITPLKCLIFKTLRIIIILLIVSLLVILLGLVNISNNAPVQQSQHTNLSNTSTYNNNNNMQRQLIDEYQEFKNWFQQQTSDKRKEIIEELRNIDNGMNSKQNPKTESHSPNYSPSQTQDDCKDSSPSSSNSPRRSRQWWRLLPFLRW